MKKEITIPQLTPNPEPCVLVAWEKNINDQIKKGDVLFEIESNKVVNQIESSDDGILIEIKAQLGDKLLPGDVIAILEI